MSDISFNTACKELKLAQIAQLNQLFQLLHLAHIYGHCFYKVSGMLMSKNVNNDVSKDSPIELCIPSSSSSYSSSTSSIFSFLLSSQYSNSARYRSGSDLQNLINNWTTWNGRRSKNLGLDTPTSWTKMEKKENVFVDEVNPFDQKFKLKF